MPQGSSHNAETCASMHISPSPQSSILYTCWTTPGLCPLLLDLRQRAQTHLRVDRFPRHCVGSTHDTCATQYSELTQHTSTHTHTSLSTMTNPQTLGVKDSSQPPLLTRQGIASQDTIHPTIGRTIPHLTHGATMGPSSVHTCAVTLETPYTVETCSR